MKYLSNLHEYAMENAPNGASVEKIGDKALKIHFNDSFDLHKLKDSDGNGDDSWTFGKDVLNWENHKNAVEKLELPENYVSGIKNNLGKIKSTKLFHKMNLVALSKKNKRVFQDEGDELCIDRLMSGTMEHWSSRTRNAKKTIKLTIDSSFNCGHDQDAFYKAGALITIFCYICEISGYGTQVEVAYPIKGLSTKDINVDYIYTYSLKTERDPFDMWRISTSGLPGIFRSSIFRAIRDTVENTAPGLGRPMKITKENKKKLGMHNILSIGSQSIEKELDILFSDNEELKNLIT